MPPKPPLQLLISISVRNRLTKSITTMEPDQSLNKSLKKQKLQASKRGGSKATTGDGGKGNGGQGKSGQSGTVEVVEKEKMQASKETVVKKTRKS